MANFFGTQSIPSALRKAYTASIGQITADALARKRVPFRNRKMQDGRPGVTDEQKAQRARFKNIIGKFNDVEMTERSRWYDAEPVYSSFLWYYNYFILSGLTGNANGQQGGFGVIKLIQHISTSLGTAGATVSIPTAIDPLKSVVMAWGAAHKMAYAPGSEYDLPYVWSIFPVPKVINSSQMEVLWSETPDVAGNCAFIVIEYI